MDIEQKYKEIQKAIREAQTEKNIAERQLEELKPEKLEKERLCMEKYNIQIKELPDEILRLTAEYEEKTNILYNSIIEQKENG